MENKTGDRNIKKLKSVVSNVLSFISFSNKTERNADLIWLDFNGKGVKYKTLVPSQCIDINTYVGHPWLAQDSRTQDALQVAGDKVYLPVAASLDESGEISQTRVNIIISIPGNNVFLSYNFKKI